jgi:ribosomal protein L23
LRKLTDRQAMVTGAIVKLGDNATFDNIVETLARAGLSMIQVRGSIASFVKHRLIKKDSEGIYSMRVAKLRVAKNPRTKKRVASRKPRKQPTRHRRSSIVVAAQKVASNTAREAEAALQVAQIFEEFPGLREALAKELCKRKRPRA